jgi:hypothetical protein
MVQLLRVRALQACFIDNFYREKGAVFVGPAWPDVTVAVDPQAADAPASAAPVPTDAPAALVGTPPARSPKIRRSATDPVDIAALL